MGDEVNKWTTEDGVEMLHLTSAKVIPLFMKSGAKLCIGGKKRLPALLCEEMFDLR